jgi:cytochrome c biogenesis protein CcmG/thiol:disulfide interchange protein DsbE
MARITNVLVMIAMLVSLWIIAGCSDNTEPNAVPAPLPGNSAPNFELQSLDGKTVSLGGLRGQPVMLNFWATWCGPCRIEMPFIQEVFNDPDWKEHGLVILAVNAGESASAARKFMESNNLSFKVLLDAEKEVMMMYNISGIPTTYFIDKDGIIRDVKIGLFQSKAEIDWRILNSIIKEES